MSDLISRQDAIKAIEELPNCYNGFSDTYDKACIIGTLEELPSAEPERKKGKWMPIQRGDQGYSAGDFICCCCGKPNKCYSLTNFCPNCGADMRGEEDE